MIASPLPGGQEGGSRIRDWGRLDCAPQPLTRFSWTTICVKAFRFQQERRRGGRPFDYTGAPEQCGL